MDKKISRKALRNIMPNNLVTFLKKEKALCAFVVNMTRRLNEVNQDLGVELLNHLNDEDAIIYAFTWSNKSNAKLKGKIWVEIHIRWVKEFNKK